MSDWKRVFVIIFTGQLFSTLSSYVVGYALIFWLSIETGWPEEQLWGIRCSEIIRSFLLILCI